MAGDTPERQGRLRRLGLNRSAGLALALQALMAIVPLVLTPFFGRTLGVEGLGLLTLGQAFSLVIASVVDFGFTISASRAVAISRHDPEKTRQILADVVAAKLFLAAVTVIAAILVRPFVPLLGRHGDIFAASVAFGVLQGMSFYWFFGGLQRQTLGSMLDFGAKASGAIGVLLVVRTPHDVAKALSGFALAQSVWVAIAVAFTFHSAGVARFSLARTVRMLHGGLHIFAQNLIGIIYNGCSALLLGVVASPYAVGVFAGAEKLARAPLMPIVPFRQIFFPMIVARQEVSERDARALWRRLLALEVFVAIACGVVLYTWADRIVLIMLGQSFSESVVLLRILAFVPAIAACGEVFGTYWLLARRRDAILTLVVAAVTVVHVLLVLYLGAWMGALGASIAVVSSQLLAMLWVVYCVLGMEPNPLSSLAVYGASLKKRRGRTERT